MVMHRALFTWFILLVFLILLSLRLETRTHWNWFLIFLPLWILDAIIFIDALFNIIVMCKRNRVRKLFQNKNILVIGIVLLKIAAQTVICLRLEYPSLQLQIHHVLIPLWILLPVLILDVSVTLFCNNSSY